MKRAACTLTVVAMVLGMVSGLYGKDPDGTVSFRVPSVGGWAITPDGDTLILSSPKTGELFVYDTVAAKLVRQIEVDFKPTALTLQDGRIVSAVAGSNRVMVIDLKTGMLDKEISFDGETIRNLTSHPKEGPIFAATLGNSILAIDSKTGKVTKTNAVGMFLKMDPKSSKYLFTGTNRPSQDFIEAETAGKTVRLRFVTVADRAAIRKYRIDGSKLTLVDGNANTAVGAGGALHVSPDGRRAAFAAGGGWRSTTDAQRARYVIAVFDATKMDKMLGSVETGPYPQNIAFHPVLNLGVALKNNVELKFFKASSLTDREEIKLDRRPHTVWINLLAFGGKGTRLIHLQGENLSLIPLNLSDAEQDQLKKHYGPLPSASGQ